MGVWLGGSARRRRATLGAHFARAIRRRRAGKRAIRRRKMANRWQYGWTRTCCGIVKANMRRIAIVEDEPAIRENYAQALRRHGYEVATYANRADAIKAFRTRLPDLALVDIGLGDDIDGGFALTRELRALSATLPIIF